MVLLHFCSVSCRENQCSCYKRGCVSFGVHALAHTYTHIDYIYPESWIMNTNENGYTILIDMFEPSM